MIEVVRRGRLVCLVALAGCSPATLGSIPIDESTTNAEADAEEDSGEGGPDIKFDVSPDTTCGEAACPNKVDMLFVIDNSGTMGEEQLNLARNFPILINELQGLTNEDDVLVGADVNIMVTTTDFGHPLCSNFAKYPPEQGAPVDTSCLDRIDRFVPLDPKDPPQFEACQGVCELKDLVPEDHFIHFDTQDPDDNNVPNVEPKDINDDQELDDAVAQTLACIAPQGVDGCGYEAPLENMLQAINPNAWWNSGKNSIKPFLRHDALLAIVIITDEADCSVHDYEVFNASGPWGDDYWNEQPGFGKSQSSAICWNAGVVCDGPDQNGHYLDCRSNDELLLQPVERYIDHLIDNVRENQGKEVVMLGILGVPPIERDDEGKITGGGVDELVIRDWEDPEWPDGDILPEDWPDEPAEYKQWLFGIGPGCTGTDEMDGFTGQAIPPVRVREVCESLDYEDNVRCCIESICDTDFRPALGCLADVIQDTVFP